MTHKITIRRISAFLNPLCSGYAIFLTGTDLVVAQGFSSVKECHIWIENYNRNFLKPVLKLA